MASRCGWVQLAQCHDMLEGDVDLNATVDQLKVMAGTFCPPLPAYGGCISAPGSLGTPWRQAGPLGFVPGTA